MARDYKPNFRHGYAQSRIDNIYYKMIARCYNEKCNSYPDYGAKGITVCDEWKNNKIAFFKWSFDNGYSDSFTLDRIDNSKGYSPENCRWVDWYVQQNNRTNNRRITISGETKTVSEWSRVSGVSPDTILMRLKAGREPESAIFDPVNTIHRNEVKQNILGYLTVHGQSKSADIQRYLKENGISHYSFYNAARELVQEKKVERVCVHKGYHKGTDKYLQLSES